MTRCHVRGGLSPRLCPGGDDSSLTGSFCRFHPVTSLEVPGAHWASASGPSFSSALPFLNLSSILPSSSPSASCSFQNLCHLSPLPPASVLPFPFLPPFFISSFISTPLLSSPPPGFLFPHPFPLPREVITGTADLRLLWMSGKAGEFQKG